MYMYLFREKMTQAYEFALDKIGMDVNSYSIWNDYIIFLKSGYVFFSKNISNETYINEYRVDNEIH